MNRTIYAVTLLLFSSFAQATLVTETWVSTVTDTEDTNVWSIGEEFTFSITYDNASTRAIQYTDGLNRVGEFGGGDDTISSVPCSGTDPDTATCSVYSPTYTSFSNADWTGIDQVYDNVIDAGYTTTDFLNTNFSLAYTNSGDSYFDYYRDFIALSISTLSNWSYVAIFTGPPDDVVLKQAFLSTRLVTSSATPMPIPTPLALMGLGLIGLRLFHRRKA